jgi:hypothetical protein
VVSIGRPFLKKEAVRFYADFTYPLSCERLFKLGAISYKIWDMISQVPANIMNLPLVADSL